MARSKGSTAKSGRQVQEWQPGDRDAGRQPAGHQHPWDQQPNWDLPAQGAPQGSAPGYNDPYAHPAYPDAGAGQQGHGQLSDPYAHGQHAPLPGSPHPQSAAAHTNWPPQFDGLDRAPAGASRGYPDSWREPPPAYQPPGGYAAPDAHSHPPLFGEAQAPQGYGAPGVHPAAPHGFAPSAAPPQPQTGYYDNEQPLPGHGPLTAYPPANAHGYGQQPMPRSDVWPAGEHETWDLSQYAPGQVPPDQQLSSYASTSGQPQGYGHDLGGHLPVADQHWPATHAQPQWGQEPRGYDPGLGQPFADPQHLQYQGYDQFGRPVGVADEDEYEDEEEVAPPRRKSRKLVIASFLVGLIGVGGGLAYGYRALTHGGVRSGSTPVVRADQSPAKMKPDDPGGKDVANIDKKFLNRLAEDRPSAATATSASSEPEGGPRKVTTLIVNRDGTLSPQLSSAPQGLPPAPPSSGVPGMFVEGLQPMQRPAPPPADPPEAAAPPQPVVTNAPPKVADLPLPKVHSEPPPPRRRPAVRDDAAAPKGRATTTASTGAAGANGYVAVLASRKSRDEALKSFVDLHQKYPDILTGRTPDVREADLGQKGVWYRLIVGPPGSREAANDVCIKLKAHGFSGCWASAY
jgi:hypothetical protein